MIFAWEVGSSVTYWECVRLAELATDRKVLEIGSWLGRSTIALASTAEMVVSVDWHQGDFYAGTIETLPSFRENLERHGAGNVEVIVARIEDVWQNFSPDFDMTFIDADHSAESAAEALGDRHSPDQARRHCGLPRLRPLRGDGGRGRAGAGGRGRGVPGRRSTARVISIIIPTIDGRERSFSRCMAAYADTTPVPAQYLCFDNRPTCGIAWNEGIKPRPPGTTFT